MYDFSKNFSSFHADHVRLTTGQQKDMKDRRDANRQRIEAGLDELGKPKLVETISQGGYAQKTMTQPPENDQESRYDIDLGVVFNEADAKQPQTIRNWIKEAINRKANLKNDPEAKNKCVRVTYAEGYQCDFPVFRLCETGKYELASGNEWEESDPNAMNKWIEKQILDKSPETSGHYQLRRIIRMGKFYAKTHASRSKLKFPGGLVTTALFIEAYVPSEGRDDEAFRETLRRISIRSTVIPVLANGVQVSTSKDTDRIGRLVNQAKVSVTELDKLNAHNTTAADAGKVWKKVFCHSFFDKFKEASGNTTNLKSASGAGLAATPPSAVAAELSNAERADRMEAAVRARHDSGGGKKPWSN